MENFDGLINWKNVFAQSETFQKNKPFKFAFIEDFFEKSFYEKLYDTYPTLDEFDDASDMSKSHLSKPWGKTKPSDISVDEGDDPTVSEAWNKLKRYAQSEEFINNFMKFTGVPANRLIHFKFLAGRKGCFQLPHIHNVGPSTIVMMLYFSKGWQKGDPGGTYMATEEDESKIIFEPYNLDNSVALFHDSQYSAHGMRYITKDVERRALQITLEGWSPETGWSGNYPDKK